MDPVINVVLHGYQTYKLHMDPVCKKTDSVAWTQDTNTDYLGYMYIKLKIMFTRNYY